MLIQITGVNGFVGKHLARELASRNMKVWGVGLTEINPPTEIAKILCKYTKCDITKKDEVSRLDLSEVNCVINLAGLANVGASFDNPELYMRVNVGVLSVLGAELYRQNPSARMIAVSSGALYDPSQKMPLNEGSKIAENGSPYAMSKLAMEDTAKMFRAEGFDCIVVRPFNHIGPGQGLGFLIPDMIEKLKKTDKKNPAISVGNINTIRDYTDVRDIVKAYADIATSKTLSNYLYNVCSGNGKSGKDILRSMCGQLGIEFNKLKINVDQSFIRPSDPPIIIGDNTRLSSDTSWKPKIDLNQTIADIISSNRL